MARKKELNQKELETVSGGVSANDFEYGPFLDPDDPRNQNNSNTCGTGGVGGPTASPLPTNGSPSGSSLGPATSTPKGGYAPYNPGTQKQQEQSEKKETGKTNAFEVGI